MWRCHKCGKPVYFAERKQSLGYDWHPECLRCEECGKRLNPGQHAEHKGVPYCHVPCYGALFGPQLFGHGTRVESHKSFGQKGTPVKSSNNSPALPRSHLESKLKTFNQFHDGRSGEIRSREVNGRLVLEGALRIHWGVKGVIHLKENDDQRTVVTIRKRNSCRYSFNKGSSTETYELLYGEPASPDAAVSNITNSSSDTGIYVEKNDSNDTSSSMSSADSGNLSSGSVSITPTPPPSPATNNSVSSSTLPSKLNFKQLDWDELDQLLQVERKLDDSDKIYQTMPTSLPSQSSVDSTESISMTNSVSMSDSFNTLSQLSSDSISESKVALLPESELSSDTDCLTLKATDSSPMKSPYNKRYYVDSVSDYDDRTLIPTSDVDLIRLLDRNDLMPLDQEAMSRSLNDDTLKVNSPIDPKKINDSLKLYGDIVRKGNSNDSINNVDSFSLNCENDLETFNVHYPKDTLQRMKRFDGKKPSNGRFEDKILKSNLSTYNRTGSLDNNLTTNNKENSGNENYGLSRSVSGPEHFNRHGKEVDSGSDDEPINYAHPVDDYIIIPNEGKVLVRKLINSRAGSTAIKRRTGRRRQRAAALKRRCSINGHFYNRETSFFTPPYGSLMSVWVTSLVSTQEVINLMLDKYKVDANAQRFALFVIKDNGEQRKLREDEYPLLVRVTLGPHEEISRLFLMDADKTGEVSPEVAQFLNLSLYECEAILQMYQKEEQREIGRIKERYGETARRIKQRMEDLKVRL